MQESPDGQARFTVPAGPAKYRVELAVERNAPHKLSTRTTLAWTFRSGHVSEPTRLPLSVVRFSPKLDAASAAPAGAPFTVPLAVLQQPGSQAGGVAGIVVDVSYDDGKTRQRTPVDRRSGGLAVVLRHPATAQYVSLRTEATDVHGNVVEQPIIHAYRFTASRRPPD